MRFDSTGDPRGHLLRDQPISNGGPVPTAAPDASRSKHARPISPAGPVAATLITNSRLLADALPELLAGHLELRLVATCTGRSPVGQDLLNPPGHIVLLDAGIGLEAAVRWTHYWRRQAPPAFVIAIELADDTATILSYIEAGIGGYTLEGATAVEVAEAISWVQQGIAHCTPRVAAELFARIAAAAPVTVPLTPRELDVLRYVNQDFSNQQIAAALVIEVRTVKHHVHSILYKLKLRHRWEAARVAAERGWLPLGSPEQ
jgi:DNA-binding NarL/FixJ family response regulator